MTTAQLRAAVERVVSYDYGNEECNYRESIESGDIEAGSGSHIFETLRELSAWVDSGEGLDDETPERISLPGGAYVETNRGERGFYWLTLPNGACVYAGVRTDPAFPDIVGATYVTLTTMDAPAANHADGEPRAQIVLNDATLYDKEEAQR